MQFRALGIALVCGGFLWGTRAAVADEPPADAPATNAPAEQPAATDKSAAEKTSAEKAAAAKAASEEYELQKLFADTIDQVERNYVKDISRRELMEAAIRGVLTKLDPYSNYISPDDLGQFKTSVENQFGGIGIQVDLPSEGHLVIVSPIVGSPAYRAGLQAGDRIVEIDGQDTDSIRSIDDAVARLKGEAGTDVVVTVVRGNRERKMVTLKRELIHLETVLGDSRRDSDDTWDFMLDHERKIGYLRITAFGRDTERDVRAALETLKQQGLRGLVLDLRFNPGGLLTSAIAVADLFVANGKIVSTEGRNTTPRSWDAEKEGTFEGFPMVVLVNRYSASASEIVSACLQDHKRAIVIGERTWGKGSVQNVIELEGGRSALKLTTASYQRPSGKNIHRFPDAKDGDEWGVVPDPGYDLKLDDGEMRQLVAYRHDRDILQVNHAAGKLPAADDKPATDATAKDQSAADKPAATEPAADKSGDAKPADPQAGGAAPAKKPGKAKQAFTDRQLQKAIDYLGAELAKAG